MADGQTPGNGAPGPGHNSEGDGGNDLQQLVGHVEHLELEKAAIGLLIKEKWKEIKGRGYAVKPLKYLIALRKMEADTRQEYEALVELYRAKLGMLDGTPLGSSAIERLEREHKKKLEAAKRKFNEPLDLGPEPDLPPPAPEPDDDTLEVTREKGAQAARDAKRITECPYPSNKQHLRAAWEEGWCQVTGSPDGMEIPSAWRPDPKPKKGEGEGEGGHGEDAQPPPPGGSDSEQPGANP